MSKGRETLSSWLSEHFEQLLSTHGVESHLETGLEFLRKRRVLDFTVSPGTINAKVQVENSEGFNCSILLKLLTDQEWQKVFQELAGESLYLAKLLAGVFPVELIDGFHRAGCELLPGDGKQLQLKTDCPDKSLALDCIAALHYRFSEAAQNDPFVVFTLRGKGRDETIYQIRKQRNELRRAYSNSAAKLAPTAALDAQKHFLASRLDRFWVSGPGLSELSYSIKADELPAAILKWLDPMPLNGLEEEVDQLIEEAYERVTRRAQAYGLGL